MRRAHPDDHPEARRGHGGDAGARGEGSADEAPVRGPVLGARPGTCRGADFVSVAPGVIHRRRYLRQGSWQLIGSILSAGAGIVSLVLTAILAPLVIAIAWFWYRPLVSVAVLAGGLVLAYGFRRMASQRAATRRTTQPVPA